MPLSKETSQKKKNKEKDLSVKGNGLIKKKE